MVYIKLYPLVLFTRDSEARNGFIGFAEFAHIRDPPLWLG